ncbi:hypothetical protein ERJ75_000831200 [Trypanosoma vivax]|uniref:Sodium stibogluconate resistance protein n=1 Tax=Trypanosoma vivax (strain Y486) TaxID=1055687 RepID=F9WPN7_TRYVY|nr:hypothetical protein TRVL_04083 [Trypanosoma vivax]KAH8612996.1 hypothetical protein ERJ75_000831200 [Trypanosoma vivax]CCD19514.1 hypothetical protein TvY486_0022110 [Trypanosoma vivax Y486]|eukprot:CCD19514.1 hypothetical protein TvY486_0022110 [Trypanosoma vivax Y486]
MGSGTSAAQNRHSFLFYEGLNALQDGRLTYAEIYYEQAIEKHEGYLFWQRLDALEAWEREANKHDKKSARDKDKEAPKQSEAEEKEGDNVSADNNSEGEEAGNDASVLIIPLDNRVQHVLSYLELRTDIALSYLSIERLEEAEAHFEYITSRTMTLMKCLDQARNSGNTGGGEDDEDELGDDSVSVHHQQNNAHGGVNDSEIATVLDCFEQFLRLHWVSAIANSIYIVFERFKGGQGDKKRKRELDAVIDTCSVAQTELYNVANRRATTLTNAAVLEHLEKIIRDIDGGSSAVTEDGQNARGGKKNEGGADRAATAGGESAAKSPPFIALLQMLPDRRLLYREMPAPMLAATLRYVPWMDPGIRRVIPGTNYHLELGAGVIDEKRVKKMQKKILKQSSQKRFDYGDTVIFKKSVDEENALLLFPILLIEADVQLELGAATKGIHALDTVEKLATQLYGAESMERDSLMQRVTETRKRGGALFMMFEDQLLGI